MRYKASKKYKNKYTLIIPQEASLSGGTVVAISPPIPSPPLMGSLSGVELSLY